MFGGRSPAPDLDALRVLRTFVRDEEVDLGLATDGDADRIALVDERGNYISTNDLLLLLYWYLREVKGQRGGVVRNLATTHLLDRLAGRFGEKCVETPVGFKWIAAGMVEHDALLGGESSGGLTVRGHILGKDGIFAAALIVEMLAVTGKRISQLLEQVYSLTGRLYAVEDNLPATPEMPHCRAEARAGDARTGRRALPDRTRLVCRRYQDLSGKRQLGPFAILRHRAVASHLFGGRQSREGGSADLMARGVCAGARIMPGLGEEVRRIPAQAASFHSPLLEPST